MFAVKVHRWLMIPQACPVPNQLESLASAQPTSQWVLTFASAKGHAILRCIVPILTDVAKVTSAASLWSHVTHSAQSPAQAQTADTPHTSLCCCFSWMSCFKSFSNAGLDA